MLSPAMADGALLQTFDHALRGGAMVLQLLIATLLIRHHARSLAARLGAAFALGVAAYAVCSWPGFAAHAVIEAWGFEHKGAIIWDKVLHNFGHYVSVRHEHLLICTRGSCTPDRPTPMPAGWPRCWTP